MYGNKKYFIEAQSAFWPVMRCLDLCFAGLFNHYAFTGRVIDLMLFIWANNCALLGHWLDVCWSRLT